MEESLRNSVEELKNRIRANLELIHENELKIKEILKEPVSKERSRKLEVKFNTNKKMLTENNDALLLQREIMKFVDTYHSNFESYVELSEPKSTVSKNATSDKDDIPISRDDYMDLIIKGAIEFDSSHPYYDDESFVNDLISYFISIEDYEMCSKLTSSK